MAKVIMEMETFERLKASDDAIQKGLVLVKEVRGIAMGFMAGEKYYCITNDELVNEMRCQIKELEDKVIAERKEKNDLVFAYMQDAAKYKNMSIWQFIKYKLSQSC